jgi:hypothetical protein
MAPVSLQRLVAVLSEPDDVAINSAGSWSRQPAWLSGVAGVQSRRRRMGLRATDNEADWVQA